MIIYNTVSDADKNPKLIRLERNLHILSFHVMKLLPAIYTLRKALKEQLINPDTLIVETSSGSFAYGIAMACTELKLSFKIVSDPKMDSLIKKQLNHPNGEIQIAHKPLEKGGLQQARLNLLYDIMEKNPDHYWPRQYDNASNVEAYFELGEHLAATLGEDLILVGPVGSGGSTCGLISGVRRKSDHSTLVGVDTFNSVLFGQKDGPRTLWGFGNSILPKNLIHEHFDEVHWVTADEAYQATHLLHQKFGIFSGPSTGAAFSPAQWLSEKYPNKNVVLISPDMGYRYIDTVYDQDWLQLNGFCRAPSAVSPIKVEHPLEAQQQAQWSYIKWGRRSP
jgi:cysteine synthase